MTDQHSAPIASRVGPILAVDYGTVRVGLAISIATLAEPLAVLPQGPHIFKQIQRLCQEHQVRRVIVGESEGEMAVRSRAFANQLQQLVSVPVEMVDETLSSHQATQRLASTHRSTGRRQVVDDKAAAVFLQEYLDM